MIDPKYVKLRPDIRAYFENFDITVTEFKDEPLESHDGIEYHTDTCGCVGHVNNTYKCKDGDCGAEIFIGFFTDEEKLLIGAFHELGHCLGEWDVELKYEDEFNAWELGVGLAKKQFNIKFSDETFQWAFDALSSYSGWEEREVTNWESPYDCPICQDKKVMRYKPIEELMYSWVPWTEEACACTKYNKL